ncbi:MAG: DUF5591 domain-containing protein [Thermoplasmata archaeon]|nr:DUF5591 domain-containing protein [Thermoplasmata archaeon]
MTRSYDRLEGLAVAGRGTIGPISLPVPSVLWSRTGGVAFPPPGGPARLNLSDAGDPAPGRRALQLSDGTTALRLEFPVATPEISAGRGEASQASPGVWVVHWPLAEEEWVRLRDADPEAIVLGNARILFREGEPFVRALEEIRRRLGANPLLWTPRVALPHRLAMLTYLGVDLVDSTEALFQAAEGVFSTAELGPFPVVDSAAERACDCPSCRSGAAVETGGHVEWSLEREMRLVRSALRAQRLRELVEARLTSEPVLAELLRYADEILGRALEERSPVTSALAHNYILKESQRRPEALRFRARLGERYRPPPSKQVLLVVPCSRTKPYRNSPSHRRLMNALEGVPNRPRLHVASVTSPLGVVPRELEDVPPARHYDIPVTHRWDEEERTAVTDALGHLLRFGAYRSVVVHLDPKEYEFLADFATGTHSVEWTLMDGRTTSAVSLRTLRDAVERALAPLTPIEGGPLAIVREELESIASFQFGPEAAHLLFQPSVRLHGRPWFQRLSDASGKDLATWREERGLFQLTMAGALRMAPAHPMEVEVRPDVPMMGDLFVPGIAHADPAIRTGDAVLLVRDGAVLAVGEAVLPGVLMNQLRRGLGVRLRHRTRVAQPEPQPTAT